VKFLADENIPKRSVEYLRERKVDVSSVLEFSPGISDHEVLQIAIDENRTIITLDSDFGTLIFKLNMKPKAGVIFFRLIEFTPLNLAQAIIDLVNKKEDIKNSLVVIDKNSIRRRKY